MKALFTAATGMSAQQTRIDNIANNLANVSTTGFKKGRENFEDLVYQRMATGGGDANAAPPTQLEIGSGTRLVSVARDFGTGALTTTSNDTDLALAGRGFFVAETPDGESFYTRDGSFKRNADGELVTGAGYTVSPGVQLPMEAEQVLVAEDGTISVTYAGEIDPVVVGQLEIVDFVNPAGLEAVGGNMYQATPESGEAQTLAAEDGLSVLQYTLEGSNVDIAEELVNMIMAQRAYELTSKVIEASDEAMQVAAGLKR